MSKNTSLRPTVVQGSVRSDGTAVRGHASHRWAGGKGQRGFHDRQGVDDGLGELASQDKNETGVYWPSEREWSAVIEQADNNDITDINNAYGKNGELLVGKRYVLAVVNHRFKYRDDDVSTPEVEDRFDVVEGREKYRMPLPEGVGVNYETVAAAVTQASRDEFTPHIASGVYEDVEVESVVLREYEVVQADSPEKVWQVRRDLWDGGSLENPHLVDEKG